jgi:beta-N-acetylhexosaminidase
LHQSSNLNPARARLASWRLTLTWLSACLALFSMLLSVCVPLLSAQAATSAQTRDPAEQAAATLERMQPEQRVGQLFLVAFNGSEAGPDSEIYNLINQHYVGGVVLLAENDNFDTSGDVVNQTLTLTRQLQSNQWAASQQSRLDPTTNATYTPPFVPMLIGLPQEGDGYPYDQILSGVTQLPNLMAIGATWNPALAGEVGKIVGDELQSLGINLLIGPALDVLENTYAEGKNNLGTRTFGGDPFWVSEMGKAYISGIHASSDGKVAVAATHFPGHGSSDRLPEEEVATVRKSLEQLKGFELAPFYSVTGNAPSTETTVDALVVSHIRYQGFQGNIRATTRPVSFDPQAFNLLMQLPPIATWRSNGGLMISDNLGSQAVRRFYELTNQTFDARRVALNAFLAGNDLLYIADFSSTELPDATEATVQTLEFFTQKYREDPAFAQRVDESVLDILTLKYKLYGDFTLNLTLAPANGVANVGNGSAVVFDVAREAATLISPSPEELDDLLPDAPNQNDRMVFITDTRPAQQCTDCPQIDTLAVDALEQVIVRRFGSAGAGQITPAYLASHSIDNLETMLAGEPRTTQLEVDLSRAHWIVFSLQDNSPQYPAYRVLSQFLVERPDLFQQKRLIVFAFNAPFYLDTTNITKLTAYYALYSKAPAFIDMASYLLFRELRATGALPITVPGIYDLNSALFPDPAQTLQVLLDLPQTEVIQLTQTPEPSPLPEFAIGDTLPLRTGIILDYNGNPVPDGTPVDFIFNQGGETRQTIFTVQGVARLAYTISQSGLLSIRVESETAKQSNTLQVEIPNANGVVPTQTPTQTATPTPTETPTPTGTPPPGSDFLTPPPLIPGITDWLMALLVTAGIGFTFYSLASFAGQVRWGVRGGFLAFICGLAAYSYIALQLPGSETMLERSVARGVILTTLLGATAGLLITWLWRVISSHSSQESITG